MNKKNIFLETTNFIDHRTVWRN